MNPAAKSGLDLDGRQPCRARGAAGDFELRQSDEVPCGAVRQQTGDERGVHGMAGAFGDDAAEDAVAGEREIADEVEHLVANEFVGKAQASVLHAVAAEDDSVFRRGAADESHVAQHALVFAEAEGARGGDLRAVGIGREIDREILAMDGRGEVDLVGDAVAVAGIDADELVVLTNFDLAQDAEVFAAAPLDLDANALEGFDIRKRAAVENGELEVVELDDDVVDADADAGGEQMLGGGDENALAHQAGGVGDLGDVAADGLDLEVVEIGAAKDDPGTGGSREKS